ncbi:MAG: hypothetical protein Q8K93_09305, partial [Reyranella sp.]|nr:hypothetical protein [Reyranella sp.]
MRLMMMGALALIVTGCGPSQIATVPANQDAADRQFGPPLAGMAAVYFYNPAVNGSAVNVMAGAMVVGQLAPKSWMRLELSPGWHAMRCITTDSANPSSITLAPGDIRYVDVEMPAGAQACTLRETGADAGRAG